MAQICHQIIDAAASLALNVEMLTAPAEKDQQAARDALEGVQRIAALAHGLREAADKARGHKR